MKSTYILSVLSIAASLGFVSLPAHADKIVNTQVINQEINITGNNNVVNQAATQTNVRTQPNANSRKGKPVPTNTDSYQEINQQANVRGNNNRVNMEAQQVNVNREGRHNRGHRGHKKDD
jgi:Tfp pilus assembly major pilin PilA